MRTRLTNLSTTTNGRIPNYEARGKVIGLFNTRDGQTMADVIWDKLGPPKRLNVNSLAKD